MRRVLSTAEIVKELRNIWFNYNYTLAPGQVFSESINALVLRQQILDNDYTKDALTVDINGRKFKVQEIKD